MTSISENSMEPASIKLVENSEPISDRNVNKENNQQLDVEKSSSCEEEPRYENDGPENDGVPYDSDWAWVVVIGCFVNYLIYNGYLKCFSLFYVELLHRFNAQASETALIFSVRSGVLSVSSLFVMNFVVDHLGERKTVLVGAVLVVLSAVLASLAKEMMLIIFVQGILLGLGQSMLASPGEVLMGAYFPKRRSLAMALAKCGASVGGIMMPLMISYFLEEYSLSGALLLTGGFCLHSIPAALLLRPISFFQKRKAEKKLRETRSVKNKMLNGNQEMTEALIRSDQQNGHGLTTKSRATDLETSAKQTGRHSFHENLRVGTEGAGESEKNGQKDTRKDLAKIIMLASSNPEMSGSKESKVFPGKLSVSENSIPHAQNDPVDSKRVWYKQLGLFHGNISGPLSDVATMVYYSNPDVHDCAGRRDKCHKHYEGTNVSAEHVADSSVSRHCSKCSKRPCTVLDFSLFSRPLFLLLLAFFLLFPTVNIMVSYLPAIAGENGVSESQTALLLSIIGGLDLVCRILCAIIANSKILKVSSMIVIGYSILGVTVQFTEFLTSFYHFLALSLLLGLLGGVANTMLPVLVLDFVGLEKMGKALGFVILIAGGAASACYPLLGYIRDVTGSYVAVYHVIGCGALLAAGVLCTEKWVRRLEEKKNSNSKLQDL